MILIIFIKLVQKAVIYIYKSSACAVIYIYKSSAWRSDFNNICKSSTRLAVISIIFIKLVQGTVIYIYKSSAWRSDFNSICKSSTRLAVISILCTKYSYAYIEAIIKCDSSPLKSLHF